MTPGKRIETELVLLDEKGGILKELQVESASIIRLEGADVLYFRKYNKGIEMEDGIYDVDGFISMTWITNYHLAAIARGFSGPTSCGENVALARQKHWMAWTEE